MTDERIHGGLIDANYLKTLVVIFLLVLMLILIGKVIFDEQITQTRGYLEAHPNETIYLYNHSLVQPNMLVILPILLGAGLFLIALYYFFPQLYKEKEEQR